MIKFKPILTEHLAHSLQLYSPFLRLNGKYRGLNIARFIIIHFLFFLPLLMNGQDIGNQPRATADNTFIECFRLVQIGSSDKAIPLLEKLSLDPIAKSTACYQLSRIYESQNKVDLATKYIDESILANPKNTWLYVYKVKLLEKYGAYDRIAETYNELIKLTPENYTFYENAAINYLRSNQLDKAYQSLDVMQKKFGNLPSMAMKKSNILTLQNKEKKAIEVLELSIKEYPYHLEIYPELILLCKKNQLTEKAGLYEKKLKGLDPSHPYFNIIPQEEVISISHPARLEESMLDHTKSLESKIKLLTPLISSLDENRNNGLSEDLKKYLSKITTDHANDPKAHSFVASIYDKAGDHKMAKSAFIKSIELNSTSYSDFEKLFSLLIDSEEWISLDKYSNLALDRYPNQSYPFFSLALSQFHQTLYPDAIKNIDQVILMLRTPSIKKSEALSLKALLMAAISPSSDHSSEFNKSISFSESSRSAILENELYLAGQGKKINTENWNSALKNSPKNFQDYKNAELFYVQKNYTEAIGILQKLIASGHPVKPSYYILLANNYKAANQMTEAKQAFEKAKEISELKSIIQKWIAAIN